MTTPNQILDFIRSECKRLNISEDSYRIGDDFSHEMGEICIDYENNLWSVFVIERGKKYGISMFDNSFDALNFFFFKLCYKPSTRFFPVIDYPNMP